MNTSHFTPIVAESPADLVGNTPLINLSKLSTGAKVYAKVESFNPAGSVKDRVAHRIIADYIKNGDIDLASNPTVIEASSGNTAIGLAAACASLGIKFIAVMPESMSMERRILLRCYGADVYITSAASGVKGALALADKLNREIPNSIIAGQFVNKSNILAHFEGTGPEIIAQLSSAGLSAPKAFVAGVGSSGTLIGAGSALKKAFPGIKIVAVEPQESAVLSGGKPGPHKIQGIGAGFIPEIYEEEIVDEIIQIPSEKAIEMSRKIALKEGMLLGVSGGANLEIAYKIAAKLDKDDIVVTVLPDSGERYLSSFLWEDSKAYSEALKVSSAE